MPGVERRFRLLLSTRAQLTERSVDARSREPSFRPQVCHEAESGSRALVGQVDRGVCKREQPREVLRGDVMELLGDLGPLGLASRCDRALLLEPDSLGAGSRGLSLARLSTNEATE